MVGYSTLLLKTEFRVRKLNNKTIFGLSHILIYLNPLFLLYLIISFNWNYRLVWCAQHIC